jgi:hypothetical protein
MASWGTPSALMENRNGLIINAMVTQADGHAEREAAKAIIPSPLRAPARQCLHPSCRLGISEMAAFRRQSTSRMPMQPDWGLRRALQPKIQMT